MIKKQLKLNSGPVRIAKRGGFTLIETLVYIALFAIILTGVFVSIYAIISGNAKLQSKALVEEEGSFLIGKVDWVLNGAESITVVGGDTLNVIKSNQADYPGTTTIKVEADRMWIKRDSLLEDSPEIELNNSTVLVTCPVVGGECFKHNEAEGLNPESVSAELIVETKTSSGQTHIQHFSTLKYLRK